MINGEIGLQIKNIQIKRFNDNTYEMTLYDKDNSCLHIVGDNDLKTLLEEALLNINEVYFQFNEK